jgi:hypothetical protein
MFAKPNIALSVQEMVRVIDFCMLLRNRHSSSTGLRYSNWQIMQYNNVYVHSTDYANASTGSGGRLGSYTYNNINNYDYSYDNQPIITDIQVSYTNSNDPLRGLGAIPSGGRSSLDPNDNPYNGKPGTRNTVTMSYEIRNGGIFNNQWETVSESLNNYLEWQNRSRYGTNPDEEPPALPYIPTISDMQNGNVQNFRITVGGGLGGTGARPAIETEQPVDMLSYVVNRRTTNVIRKVSSSIAPGFYISVKVHGGYPGDPQNSGSVSFTEWHVEWVYHFLYGTYELVSRDRPVDVNGPSNNPNNSAGFGMTYTPF